MTADPRVSLGDVAAGNEPRLALKPSPAASPYLDGAWWPRSTQLTAELPSLLDALSDRLGAVKMVGYHLSAWKPAPPQMQIAGATVELQGFSCDQPATVILIGGDGRRICVLVIAPDATEQVAQGEMDAASKNAGDGKPPSSEADHAAANSVTEVAAQLDSHEGRGDSARTAEIAQWCQEAAEQFVNAPVQGFVPILVHHMVRNRMSSPRPAS